MGGSIGGCPSDPYQAPQTGNAAAADAAKDPGDPATPKSAATDDRPPTFVAAGPGAAHEVVREAVRAAKADGVTPVVYVGATWCEPCTEFHHAVEAGRLDEALANVRFLEFDSDRDGTRLDAAGYSGRLIPRFVIPGIDGRATASKIEGGIKGPGAVDDIMARLGPLLSR